MKSETTTAKKTTAKKSTATTAAKKTTTVKKAASTNGKKTTSSKAVSTTGKKTTSSKAASTKSTATKKTAAAVKESGATKKTAVKTTAQTKSSTSAKKAPAKTGATAVKKTTAKKTEQKKTVPAVKEVKEPVKVTEVTNASETPVVKKPELSVEEKNKIRLLFNLATIVGTVIFAFGTFALFFNFSRDNGIAGTIIKIVLIPALLYLWPSLALCFPKVIKKNSFLIGLLYYAVIFGIFCFVGLTV